jgi:fibronectin type 3 domain-containing protein
VASTSSNAAGYNVYRGAISGGPYTKVNSSLIVGTTYTDSLVQAGQSYYYVATAVDTSGNESAYSAPPVQTVIPSP